MKHAFFLFFASAALTLTSTTALCQPNENAPQAPREKVAEYVPTPGETATVAVPGEKTEPIQSVCKFFPNTVYWGDPLYLVFFDKNIADEPAFYSTTRAAEIDATISSPLRASTYSWTSKTPENDGSNGVSNSQNPPKKLLPGEERLSSRHFLEFPPLKDWNAPFWRELRESSPPNGVVCRLTLSYRQETARESAAKTRRDEKSRVKTVELEILIQPRPKSETALLEQWSRAPNQKSGVPNVPSTLDDWRDLEARFAPSSFRDEIRLTRLRLEYATARDGAESEQAKAELVDWLRSLPEVQRSATAARLASKRFEPSNAPASAPLQGEKRRELRRAVDDYNAGSTVSN